MPPVPCSVAAARSSTADISEVECDRDCKHTLGSTANYDEIKIGSCCSECPCFDCRNCLEILKTLGTRMRTTRLINELGRCTVTRRKKLK